MNIKVLGPEMVVISLSRINLLKMLEMLDHTEEGQEPEAGGLYGRMTEHQVFLGIIPESDAAHYADRPEAQMRYGIGPAAN